MHAPAPLGLSPRAIQVRRALGLYAFAFICIHVAVYAVAENGLDVNLIVRDLDERRAMLIGFAGFLLLIPLAVTSTAGWQRRLGKRWRTLHRLVYAAAILSVWHYLWLDRDIITTPLIYAVISAACWPCDSCRGCMNVTLAWRTPQHAMHPLRQQIGVLTSPCSRAILYTISVYRNSIQIHSLFVPWQ